MVKIYKFCILLIEKFFCLHTFAVISLDEVDSTNNYAKEAVKAFSPADFTIIKASVQKQGKGQGKNFWYSEKDKNLTISIIIYPKMLLPEQQFKLSVMTSLAICDLLQTHNIQDVQIKWPNDILVKGKKICGILIENTICSNHIENSVIGIGLNINQDSFPSFLPDATSMYIITGKTYIIDSCLQELAHALYLRYQQVQDAEDSFFYVEYLQRLYGYNQQMLFRDKQGLFKANIKGINEYGLLLLLDTHGTLRTYRNQEVIYVK